MYSVRHQLTQCVDPNIRGLSAGVLYFCKQAFYFKTFYLDLLPSCWFTQQAWAKDWRLARQNVARAYLSPATRKKKKLYRHLDFDVELQQATHTRYQEKRKKLAKKNWQ